MSDLTPSEVAAHLRVSGPTVRRMAAVYEAVLGDLPRDERGARRWPLHAVRQVEAAHRALATGKVTSLEYALKLVRDGAELPERVVLDPLPVLADSVLLELVGEVRALRQVVEAQAEELAAIRADLRALPAPAPVVAQVPRKASKAPAAPQPARKPRPSRAKSTPTLPHAVTVLEQRVPRGIKWKPEKYAAAERLLAQGHTLTRMSASADYSTETGELMSWRTVQALLKLGVVVALV